MGGRAGAGAHTARLVERGSEQAVIEAALSDVSAGRGRVLVVTGPPGIGKTALAELTAGSAVARGHTVLEARCTAQGLGRDLSALNGLEHLWTHRTEDRAVTLLVEDVQWCDPASARFLEDLAARLDRLPLLLVLTSAPQSPVAETVAAAAGPRCVVLTPAPLQESGVLSWLHAALGDGASAALARATLAATGGNPFLVGEVVQGAADRAARGLDQTGPPYGRAGGVGAWVRQRLRPLGEAAVQLVHAAAVLDGAEISLLAKVIGIPLASAGPLLHELARVAVLVDAVPVCFVHPLVRHAVLESVPLHERQLLHRRAADVLHDAGAPTAVVAEHLLLSPPGLPDWAVALLHDAGRHATTGGGDDAVAVTAAVELLSRVLAETPPGTLQQQVLRELGAAEIFAGQQRAGLGHLRLALTRSAGAQERVRASLALAAALRSAARGAEAAAVLQAALPVPGERDAVPADLRAALDLEMLLCTASSRAARLALVGWRAEHVQDPGGTPTTAWATVTLASTALDGALDARPLPVLLDQLARTVAAAQLLPDPRSRGQALGLAATAYVCVEQFDDAEALIERLLQRAASGSSAGVLATTLALRASLHLRRGDLVAAQDDAVRALELGSGTEAAQALLPRAGAVLVSAAAARGTRPPQHLVHDELDQDSTAARLLAHSRAELLLAHGHDRRAAAELLAYGARNVELGWSGCATPWRSQAGLALHRLGESRRAYALVHEELDIAGASGAPRAIAVATGAAGLLASGTRRSALLDDAVELLSGTGCRLELAAALLALGADLQQTGRASRARTVLRQAHDLAEDCGAGVLVAESRRVLRRAGARPRRPASRGGDALTAAEQRVADLVGKGLTNRQVADELFITVKTVETHLGRVFAKLGISSRQGLTAG